MRKMIVVSGFTHAWASALHELDLYNLISSLFFMSLSLKEA